ncbi:hypothetical protein DPO94_02635 [Salmonella enterica subsp. enterica serovar Emek]|uniref:hypothetical protein n=1 Tax=Salmonella enterica TaxID=28901 RepID=UPI000F928D51|nr:hypothetical protein [Salmonella enterica subsp. enterica serovar Lexington]EAA5191922.1 hypothetical protein [Salmonella enterica subsp. enterica serovar Indiana]EAA7308937.1 hypothetical protein [Salmonella enterica subsp. enterica serovar Duesseldorf]EAA7886712.1 hypothetical protein [Salmonella enterica]EAB6530600.1 hypothetical protein [Salmonella enterica subsp. enterica serovar Oranienburg]EAC0961384.1 hypothetical protein [Salmonella enterica subsp. enterica serovar Newport]EBG5995
MDFEITGEETHEQLEELMAKMGEIEVKGDDEEPEESAEHPGSESSETVQTDTCDKQAPTPGAGTEEEGQPQEYVKGILARDGKHVIPYDVLEAERTGRQRVEQEAFLLKQQLAEEQRKIDLLTSQIKQAGMTPDPLPEDTRISDEQIARIKEEYPEVANALTLMARKYDYLQARIQEAQQVPQENPVVQAMNAVPDLVVWQRSDPDKFAVAIHLDEKLQTDPAWKDKPLTERFAEVARRTRAAYGEVSPEPVAEQDKNQKVLAAVADKVAKADAAAALPDSPSDVGNTAAVPQDKFEQLLGASYADAEAVMSGMSDADIDAILEKLG